MTDARYRVHAAGNSDYNVADHGSAHQYPMVIAQQMEREDAEEYADMLNARDADADAIASTFNNPVVKHAQLLQVSTALLAALIVDPTYSSQLHAAVGDAIHAAKTLINKVDEQFHI